MFAIYVFNERDSRSGWVCQHPERYGGAVDCLEFDSREDAFAEGCRLIMAGDASHDRHKQSLGQTLVDFCHV